MKRKLFDELSEGFDALKAVRQGKVTLKQHRASSVTAPTMTSAELVKLRMKLNVSQAVLAQYLCANKRTLENWEQGRANPNAQARVLLRLVEKYPDTIERLASV
jgi:putative transcriptional regulator